jgi:hypothetical protein
MRLRTPLSSDAAAELVRISRGARACPVASHGMSGDERRQHEGVHDSASRRVAQVSALHAVGPIALQTMGVRCSGRPLCRALHWASADPALQPADRYGILEYRRRAHCIEVHLARVALGFPRQNPVVIKYAWFESLSPQPPQSPRMSTL